MDKINPTTLFIGQKRLFLPSCQSTNDIALGSIRHNTALEGFLVWTEHQTSGRGQRGSTWESRKGENLTCSLILQPSFIPVQEQFALSMAISLAIYDLLELKLPKQHAIHIKWPNDIYVDDLKIAGILIENQLRGAKWVYSTIGIGLNINQQEFVQPFATSLAKITGDFYSLEELLERLLVFIEKRYLQLRNRKKGQLRHEYLQHLYLKDTWHWFENLKQTAPLSFYGAIQDVNKFGHLEVLLENGQTESFAFKEIRLTTWA